MSAKSEEQIILKLLLKGQNESDILDHLKKHNLIDDISIYRVQTKIREMKAAQAFLPYTPSFFDRFSRAIGGLFLIIVGGVFTAWSLGIISILGHYVHWRYGFVGGTILVCAGIAFFLKGLQRSRW